MDPNVLPILACPLDGAYPLGLAPLSGEPDDVEEGLLSCPKCGRWFPIHGGIPHLVRDGLRFPDRDRLLVERHRDRIPRDFRERADIRKYYGGEETMTSEDRLILDEGAYWSSYSRLHYAVGDTSFLDVRSRSTHPSFYPLGVLERDDKDRNRKFGMWPDHLSRIIYGFLHSIEPGWALDAGCGAGQFGLEASYRGWNVAAIDIAVGALSVGRDYARRIGRSMHYIYAEPSHPPFRRGAFDLLMAKDSLHHLPRLDVALSSICSTLKPEARALIFDHIGSSPLARLIKDRVKPFLHAKILRRYPRVAVPEDLLRESPSEDAGRDDVLSELTRCFDIHTCIKEIMLYHDLEFSIHYAYGRRLWFTRIMTFMIRWLIEKPMMLFQPAEFAVIIGKRRP